MGEEEDCLAALQEENRLLREENERLRRLLNDPDKLLQRGLHILASMQMPNVALLLLRILGIHAWHLPDVTVYLLRFAQELAHLAASISPW